MPMTQFATTLSDYIRAGYPAIAVTTHEEERLLRDLQTLKDVGWSFASWSAVRGWRDPEGKAIQGTTAGATAPTAVLEIQKLQKKTVAVFFDLQTHFVIEPDTIRAIRDALEIAKSSFRPMLLCSPYSTLPLELEKDVALLDYALPRQGSSGTSSPSCSRASSRRPPGRAAPSGPIRRTSRRA